MKVAQSLFHLIIPRQSNNQKAKLLHSSSLMIITLILVVYQLFLTVIPRMAPRILGYAANISPDEVIRLTNEKRLENGLAPLQLNGTLSQAALAKGTDMLNRDYWAHMAPDGTQPWKFISDAGYKYRYAGENLARDFSNPASAVEAWMVSPSHKENLLSPKYKEIGVAVVEGDLAGVDTTIIVQMFGTPYQDTIPAVPVAKAEKTQTSASPQPEPLATATQQPAYTASKAAVRSANPIISPFNSTRNISLAVIVVLLVVLVIDGVITSKQAIVRIGGRTFAHMAFLGMVLAIVLILKAGQIL